MNHAIVVCGDTNGPDGSLSYSAKNRLATAATLYHKKTAPLILVSGGTWPHFNKSSKPHSYWMHKYLISKRVPAQAIIQETQSRWTTESALYCLDAATKHKWNRVTILTSSWHMPRTHMIFAMLWPQNIQLTFIACKDKYLPKRPYNVIFWEAKGCVRDFFKVILYKILHLGVKHSPIK